MRDYYQRKSAKKPTGSAVDGSEKNCDEAYKKLRFLDVVLHRKK